MHTNTDINDKRHKQRFGWVKRLMNNRNHNGELGKYPQEGRDTYDSDSSSEFSRSVAESAADSDQGHSDNISTIPLKSITSIPSTKSPSVLSDKDNNSYMASTAETSLAPSGHTVGLPSPQTTAQTASTSAASASNTPVNDRDQESIVTLASSSRRVRRRSLDTNSSTTGIAPASIMERLSVHPTAASAYAPSAYATSGYASSTQNSHIDAESETDEKKD